MKRPGDIVLRVEWLVLAALVAVLLESLMPSRGEQTTILAVFNVWVNLGLLLVSYLLQAAFAPKQKPPERQKGKLPDVKDGKRVRRAFGTIWMKDPTQLAMKQMGEDPIRKGGKK